MSAAPPRGPQPAAPRVPRTPLDRLAARWRASAATLWAVATVMGLFELLIAGRVLIIHPRADIRPLLGLALLVAAALLGRRRQPLAVVILTGLICAGVSLWGPQDATFSIPPLVALYSLFAIAGTAQRIIGLLAVFGCWTLPLVVIGPVRPLIGWITPEILLLAVVVTAAAISRSRREALEHGDALLAAQAAEHQLMAQRDAARRQARVAGELHDSVGHSLTAIIALTEGLAGTADDPELDEAIATVNALARDGLADTRSAVNALQPRPGPDDPDDAAGPAAVNAVDDADGNPPAEPGRAHGWDDLTAVLDTTRRTGLAVALTETGPRPQDPGIADAVFTLVREALTNVMRHADGATRVTVALDHSPGRTAVTVVDDGAVRPVASGMRDGAPRPRADPDDGADGTGPADSPSRTGPDGTGRAGVPASAPARVHARGHGLAGLAAFAAARGGALVAGPTDAGWRLHATIARGGRP
ncbi:sensor histidine kinase [Actinomyces dentalis]|uniref:sensor histidine kinase n=1 Tax=Actinomyces dentalis TaxID=272548 RepID=UPI00235513B0|nr:histidine kinase [Actinomyces dentalis]